MATNDRDDGKDPRKSIFRSRKVSQFDAFDINVSKAQKDADAVFSHFKQSLSSFEKSSQSTLDNIAGYAQTTFKNVYSNLGNQHQQYLSQLIKREQDAYNTVQRIWGRPIKHNIENNVVSTTYDDSEERTSRPSSSNNSSRPSSTREETGSRSVDMSLRGLTNSLSQFATNKMMDAASADTFGKTAGNVIASIIGSTLEVYLSKFLDRFEKGMDRITGTYEQTFHTVALQTRMTEREYANWQNSTVNTIRESGQFSAIRVSDAMRSLEEVTKEGISDQRAGDIAIQDTYVKTMNPYLDTTSTAFKDLQLSLGEDYVKGTTGIISALNQELGESRYMTKNLNEMITLLEPVSRNATAEEANRMMEQYAGIFESLRAQGATEEEIQGIKNTLYQVQTDPYGAVTSGNIYARTLGSAVASGNIEADDIAGQFDFLMSDLRSTVGRAGSQIEQGAIASAFDSTWARNLSEKQLSLTGDAAETILGKSEDAYESLLNDLSDTQTALYRKETRAENLSTSIAGFKQQYPDAFSLLSSIAANVGIMAGSMLFGGKGFGSGGLGQTGRTLLDLGKSALGKQGITSLGTFSDFAGATGGTSILGKAGSLLSSNGAKMFGTIGGSLQALIDGGMLAGRASEIFQEENNGGEANAQQVFSSFLGGAVGGQGSGLTGALGNAAKGAMLGTAIGGPIGTLIGGGIGAITGFIGGEALAKGADEFGESIGKTAVRIGDIWEDDSKNIGEKLLGTVGEAGTMMARATVDGIKAMIPELTKEEADRNKQQHSTEWEYSKDRGEVNLGVDTEKYAPDKDKKAQTATGGNVKAYDNDWVINPDRTGDSDYWYNKMSGQYAAKDEIQEYTNAQFVETHSHASGLDRVPYDGYVSVLHKDEAVLNKTAASYARNLLGIEGTSVGEPSILSRIRDNSTSTSDVATKSPNNSDVVDAIKWAVNSLLPAIEAIATATTGRQNTQVQTIPTRTPQLSDDLINMVPTPIGV